MHIQAPTFGVLAPSLLGPGGANRLPFLRNRSATTGPLGTLVYRYELEYQVTDQEHKVVVYLDGDSDGLASDTLGYQTAPLGTGTHDLDALVLDEDWFPPDTLIGSSTGNRVRLSWPRAAASDVVAYRVYWDAGTGTVDTLIDTVDLIRLRQLIEVASVGGGRVTIEGNYQGIPRNDSRTLAITDTSNNIFTFDGESYDFTGESMRNLPDGLRVYFLDPANLYDDSDTWEVVVGPLTEWKSEELASDTYKFAVSAVDAAGNESTLSNEVTLVVASEVSPPSGVSVSYDGTDIDVSLTQASGATEVRIYSNIDAGFEVVRPYVQELFPIATITAPATTATISISGLDGRLLFYARSFDGTREEDNINLIEVNYGSTESVNYEPPFNLAANPGPAGVAVITWDYLPEDLLPNKFQVFEFTSQPTLADVNAASPLTTVTYAGGNGYTSYTHTTSAIAGQRWYVVRAVNASDVGEQNATSVSVTPDSTAPVMGTVTGEVAP
jgi:hypothetical protein